MQVSSSLIQPEPQMVPFPVIQTLMHVSAPVILSRMQVSAPVIQPLMQVFDPVIQLGSHASVFSY
jgi:hypothetical protein